MEAADRAFLEVEQSLQERRWIDRLGRMEAGQAEQMVNAYRISELLARILAARGVEADEAVAYLNPTLRDLMPDPSSLTDMNAAAGRIADAVEKKEQVAVFGDYDVDGATSSALMARFLRACGVEAQIYIPDRIFEGYGPNPAAIRELVENGATLIITVDCGSTSLEALAEATKLHADTVVLDHHQVGDELPAVTALVNPNRQDDLSGQGHLCAAGVVFLTLVAVNRELRKRGYFEQSAYESPDLMSWLDLVALGTVCDVVPLRGLNRAYVLRGIEIMRGQGNAGISALARAARQDGPAAPWHLGFVLGPRINAGGRIGDAALGAKLLTTHDPAEAEDIATQLEKLNAERQAMEAAMLAQAIDEADAEMMRGDGPAVLVTESETWHAGVVGLIASRLKDRYRRPAFAITFDERGGGTGSGRSIAGIDLGVAVRRAVESGLLEKGGGHAMAAGVTLRKEKLGGFRAFLEEQFSSDVQTLRNSDVLKVDGALAARGATLELFDEIQRAGPFGAGNPQPVFAFPNHGISFADRVGANHVRFSIASPDGAKLSGIAFRAAETPMGDALLTNRGESMHFAGTLSADFYRGTRRIQLRLLDVAAAS